MSIVGPTSSGKTAVSIDFAKKLKGLGITAEIVSADSRQVYKGLDLLSGKVTKKEMGLIPHHMLDVVSSKKVRCDNERNNSSRSSTKQRVTKKTRKT